MTLYYDCDYMWLVYRRHYPGGNAFGRSIRFICIFWMWIRTRLLIKRLGLLLPDILKPSKPNIVWLNFILAIPNLWFHLDIYVVGFMHSCLQVVINWSELYLCFILNIICDCKSRDNFVATIALRIQFSSPFWVKFSGSGSVDPREARGR